MEILLWSFAFFLTVLFFLQKGIRFALFRSVGWVMSIAVIGTLNVNWLLGIPITMNLLGLATLVGVILAVIWDKKKNLWKNPFVPIKKDVWVPLFVFCGAIVLGWQYLGFQWDVPRYATPDPGTHFLYMFQTAQTGIMPMFEESRIYPATGHIEGWKLHHMSYFPGSTAIFFVLNYLSPFTTLETFQLGNVLVYALICGYFFALSMRMLLGVWRYLSYGVFAFVVLYGVFFEFVVASFTTQALGLFLLFFFVDMYHQYRKGKMPIWFSWFSLAALVTTYIYWIPVALLFIFFERMSDIFFLGGFSWKKFLRWAGISLVVPIGAIFLAWGYVIVAYQVNIVGYSSADGGFPVQKEILRDVIVVVPFAFFAGYFLLQKWWRKKKADPVLNLFLASFVFSFVVILLYILRIQVSHYTAFKSLYLLLPFVWILALSYLTQIFSFLRDIVREKKITLDLVRFRRYIFLFGALYVITFAGTFFAGISWKVFPLQKQNMTFARGKGGIGSNLTREQWQLLDIIKRDYQWILQDNRVLVVAPPDTALWTFAYAGIWPRPSSLLDPETPLKKGEISPMDMYAPGIADYQGWFNRDSHRILVYFQTKESKKWLKKEKFPIDKYEILYSVGDNHIYRWRGDKQ